jgi:5-methylcytosine-specific restriction protein A
MPSVPTYTKCSMLGCKSPRSKHNSYCIQHGGRDTYNTKHNTQTSQRVEQIALYQTTQWQTLRQIQLSKQPLCQACLIEGVVTQAEHIDHLFPWMQLNKEAFYINLFQSLCAKHHREKTHLEQRGVIRYYNNVVTDFNLSDYPRLCL